MSKEALMPARFRTLPLLLGGLIALVGAAAGEEPVRYPHTRRVHHIDRYHGTEESDPYRWLEKDPRASKEVATWVDAQNAATSAYLTAIPQREAIRRRLKALRDLELLSPPAVVGGRYFYYSQVGLRDQSVLCARDVRGGPPWVVLDPNLWQKFGPVDLVNATPSPDGRYLAYGAAWDTRGWTSWQVMDLSLGSPPAETIGWVAPPYGPSWSRDGKGFYYTSRDVHYHRLGTPQSEDRVIYSRPDHAQGNLGAYATPDGRYLVLGLTRASPPTSRFAYQHLAGPSRAAVELIEESDHEYGFLGNDGPVFYVQTDLDAPRGRVVAIDTRKPRRKDWKEVIPQAEDLLVSVDLVGDFFVTLRLKDARPRVRVYARDGAFVRDVPLPGVGTIRGLTGGPADAEVFYS
jgi:prolyl oligopeptidase